MLPGAWRCSGARGCGRRTRCQPRRALLLERHARRPAEPASAHGTSRRLTRSGWSLVGLKCMGPCRAQVDAALTGLNPEPLAEGAGPRSDHDCSALGTASYQLALKNAGFSLESRARIAASVSDIGSGRACAKAAAALPGSHRSTVSISSSSCAAASAACFASSIWRARTRDGGGGG